MRLNNSQSNRGFTMVEVMVVLGIAAMLVTMAIPFVGGLFNENPIRDTTKEVMSLLEQARAQSILTGKPYEFVISRQDYKIIVRPAPEQKPNPLDPNAIASFDDASISIDGVSDTDSTSKKAGKTLEGDIHPEITIELIDVNYVDMSEFEQAIVNFRPNGTSDKFTFVFQRGPGEYRLIRLDMMTALANFETDPQKFLDTQY